MHLFAPVDLTGVVGHLQKYFKQDNTLGKQRNKITGLITGLASSAVYRIKFAGVQSTVAEHVARFVAYGNELERLHK